MGFMPAATALAPSRTIACARTVAVVVPSPAWSEVFEATSRTICAPMFSNLSSSSISFATVTPSFVMRGAPKLLSSTTLRPFGPSVTLTALARMSTPRSILSRASVENRTSFALMIVPPEKSLPARFQTPRLRLGNFSLCCGFSQHPENVCLLHDQVFDAVELDLRPRPFAEQHTIADLDVDRREFS